MYADYPIEQKRDRRGDPAISVYLINSNKPYLEKMACMYCKRTICDFKGRIDKIIDAPIDIDDFGVGVNIMCKLCHQQYRLVLNARNVIEVQTNFTVI